MSFLLFALVGFSYLICRVSAIGFTKSNSRSRSRSPSHSNSQSTDCGPTEISVYTPDAYGGDGAPYYFPTQIVIDWSDITTEFDLLLAYKYSYYNNESNPAMINDCQNDPVVGDLPYVTDVTTVKQVPFDTCLIQIHLQIVCPDVQPSGNFTVTIPHVGDVNITLNQCARTIKCDFGSGGSDGDGVNEKSNNALAMGLGFGISIGCAFLLVCIVVFTRKTT